MKLLSYNLYNGAIDTFDLLVEFINREKPDILCLQEANGWEKGSPSRLKQFSDATGLDYQKFSKSNTDFDLVIFSRIPIDEAESITNGFWHSIVRATIRWRGEKLNIWNVHLDPRAPKKRLVEIKQLVSHLDMSKCALVVGDFNSLDREDSYPSDLLKQLGTFGITKFGTKQLSFEEMDYLFASGFVDTAKVHGCSAATVPTRNNQDINHSIPLRLDRVLATQKIDKFITNTAVVKDSLTDVISDHYPISVSLIE